MSDAEINLTITTYRDEMTHGTVVRLHDNMTPSKEIRYAQYLLADSEMERAPSRAIMWYTCMELLVQEFNKAAGKKVKLINTFGIFGIFGIFGHDDEVPPDVLPLPYSMGLVYYSDTDA